MTTLWSFDFGKVTGMAWGFYGPNTPYSLIKTYHIRDGIDGFLEHFSLSSQVPMYGDVVVAEKFTASPGNDFLANLDGVPIEGALAHAIYPERVHWQTRNQKQKAGMYDTILKEHGLWQSADDVEWTDGRDANDSIIHALEYLRTLPHLPTLRKYFSDDYNAV